jgi:hypothetical protein
MTWTCEGFGRWLDDGRPGRGLAAATAHAAGCPTCRSALSAAIAVEEALSLEPTAAAAPACFTDTVMRRVSAARAARGELRLRRVLPWWVGAIADPMLAGTGLLLALLAWRHEMVWSWAVRLSVELATWLDAALQGAAAVALPAELLQVFASPGALLGIGFAAAPVLLWASWLLLRWAERMALRAAGGAGSLEVDTGLQRHFAIYHSQRNEISQ